jgi:hypothetical protein
VDVTALRVLADGGFIVALLTTLVGGYRGWWVFGPQHQAIVTDLAEQRDFWRTQALRSTTLAEKAVAITDEDA